MNPRSPLTYYLRHKRITLLLMGLIALMTWGVCTMVRLLNLLPEGIYAAGSYLTRVSLVSSASPSFDPGVVSKMRAHAGIAYVIQHKGLPIGAPYSFGEHHLFGVTEADMLVLMDTCELGLKQGRLPQPRTNEMVLTEEMANAMGLQIGDQIDHSIGEDWAGENHYAGIPVPLELVGILQNHGPEPHMRLGFVSYEYVDSHSLFVSPWSRGLVVIAHDGQLAEVERFLESEIASPSTQVVTHRQLSDRYQRLSERLHVISGVVDVLVAIVMALVIAAINQIAQADRLREFGVLNALGYSRKGLLSRFTLGIATTTGLGWLVGLALAWMGFALLKESLLRPKGIPLGLITLTPFWFSLPVPLIPILVVAWTTRRALAHFDAVAIIERGKLAMEATGEPNAGRPRALRTSIKPLSPLTFCLRHRGRTLMSIATMGLMILGVSFPAFLLAPVADALRPFAEPLRTVGVVTPRAGAAVDPGVTAQVRSHPTVARVLPAMPLTVRVQIPPLGWVANFYAVSQNDMQLLVERLGMRITEGRLPHPRTNEVVLSEALAQNRGWCVGNRIGAPVDEDDRGIPTELVIVGILAPGGEAQEDPWMGLASYEYLSSHERYASYPVHLLTLPAEGEKAAMDTWLREEVHSDLVEVYTYQWMLSNFRLMGVLQLGVFAVVESIIAIVAAVALGVLSYVAFIQRREEFGILHAIGRSRSWLVLRVVRETVSTIGLAWLLAAMVCVLGLASAQAAVYAPLGLTMNIMSPAPWLFTLPMPLAVIAVSTGLVCRVVGRLDPVAIIERR